MATSMDQELRIFACDSIQNAGILLKLPQIAMTTAQMLLQRVYSTPEFTFARYHFDITAMAALFLAAKVEEYPRKAREVIDVFVHLFSLKMSKDYTLSHAEHEKVREELITAERRILKNLGFNLLSSYPHKILVNYYYAIVNKLDPDNNVWKEKDSQRLLQKAWNYCNDSLRTNVFFQYPKEAVACACIQMACQDVQMPFPKSTDGREWYCLFTKDKSQVEAAQELIKSLYSRKYPSPRDFRRHMYLNKLLN